MYLLIKKRMPSFSRKTHDNSCFIWIYPTCQKMAVQTEEGGVTCSAHVCTIEVVCTEAQIMPALPQTLPSHVRGKYLEKNMG